MELSEYMKLMQEFEELLNQTPTHMRLGKVLEFVRDNFKPFEIWDIYSDSLLETTAKEAVNASPKSTYL